MSITATQAFEQRDLEHPGLRLRTLRASDAGPIHLYASDRRVAEMTTAIPHPYPPGAAESFIDAAVNGRSPEHVWAIDATPADGPEFIGLISYRARVGEIGYWIGPPFWGTGYASLATQVLADHLLGERGLPELRAHVLFDNPASQQVLKKAGFSHVGDTWLHSVGRGQEVPALTFRLSADARVAGAP